MNYPPRFAHLATQKVLVAKLIPTFSAAHRIDEEEARERLSTALHGALLEQLLEATWGALTENRKRLDDDGLLEKIAGSLAKNPYRPGKELEATPGWSAFMVLADVEAGTATDAARRLLESEEGKRRGQAGIREVGAFLAKELTKKA